MKNICLSKSKARALVEPFIFEKLTNDSYEVLRLPSISLMTWNRFDLGFKLFYLDIKDKNNSLALFVYESDIRSQTLGCYEEFGSKMKNTFEKYIFEFKNIYQSIKINGFDEKSTLIPLSTVGTIINGSHRVAAAIHTLQDVSCIKTEQPIMTCDYEYFFQRKVPENILDVVATKFIEYADDVYIAFLWPSGKDKLKQAEAEFSNIIYKKNISLTAKGGFNLIVELYKHMDWVGGAESGYPGAKKKLVECFPTFDPLTVISFQESSIKKIMEIKERVRKIHNIGFSSVHITDTKEEAVRISRLVFNKNGIHFLNYAEPDKFSLTKSLGMFNQFLEKNNINPEDVLIDGSIVLSLYGLRKNIDIDFLVPDKINIPVSEDMFESHESELVYHGKEKDDLIYNQKNYFEYLGFKFISFHSLFQMKSNRGGEKDINDCRMMRSLVENNRFSKYLVGRKQALFYIKIKLVTWRNNKIRLILNTLGLYEPVKSFYRKLRRRVD